MTELPQTPSHETETKSKKSSPFQKVGECLYRHESSRQYYALVKDRGKQHRKSLKTADRKLADRRLDELIRKIRGAPQRKDAASVTFDALAKVWLQTRKPGLKASSFKRLENSVNQLRPFIGDVLIRKLTSAALEDWATKRGQNISASTYNNERDTIIALLEYAKREGLLLDNPALVLKRRKLPKSVVVIPSKEQFSKLVQTLRAGGTRREAAADLVELMAFSGARVGEATTIRWRDVSFDQERFVITGGELGTKNHEERAVPLFPSLRRFLEKLRERDQPEPDDLIVGLKSAKKAMESACKKAELPNYTHHTMRHYFVSNAIEAGIDGKVIANWVGHRDGGLLVAKTYGHLRDDHSNEMAKRM